MFSKKSLDFFLSIFSKSKSVSEQNTIRPVFCTIQRYLRSYFDMTFLWEKKLEIIFHFCFSLFHWKRKLSAFFNPAIRLHQDVSSPSYGRRQACHRLRCQDQGQARQVRRRHRGRQALDEPVRRDRRWRSSPDEREEAGQWNHCSLMRTCSSTGSYLDHEIEWVQKSHR